jgi:hypothetical protein
VLSLETGEEIPGVSTDPILLADTVEEIREIFAPTTR